MTIFALKCIAVITMVIDHVGAIYFPDILAFRIVGRLAFPIFAWLIGNGATHSKDVFAYARRLLIFACISEIPFFLAFYDGSEPLIDATHNIFFTLLFGLISILIIRNTSLGLIRYPLACIPAYIAMALHTDYGAYGVLLILLLSLTQKIQRRSARLLCQTLGMTILLFFHVQGFDYQFIAIASIPLLAFQNGQQGPRYTKFFYWFYPIHLLLLGLGRFFLY